MLRKLKVGVIMGGPSNEYEVSLQSGENIYAALKNHPGFFAEKILLPKSKKAAWQSLKESIKILKKFDLIFNALHGEFGEDGTIQKFFEDQKIYYTGSDSRASKIGMDKILSKKLFKKAGLNVASAVIFHQGESLQKIKIRPPFVIKPAHCGSSIGVSIIQSQKELLPALKRAFRYGKILIIEKYLKGREITCGVLENFRGKKIYPLIPTEIIPQKDKLFNYRAKYTPGASLEITPAFLPTNLLKLCQKTAVKTHQAIGARHYSRTDMILVEKPTPKFYVLEINTLPGLTKNSLLPKQLKAVGLEFKNFLEHLIKISLKSRL